MKKYSYEGDEKMAKVYIIHENIDWTQHLIKRLEELSVPYEELNLSEGVIDIQKEPEKGVYYNRMSASSHTRGHRYAPELTEQVLTWLENKGAVVINGTSVINLEVSKLKQYILLQKFGIKTPESLGAVGKEQILSTGKKLNKYPFIIKHNRAGKGLGVRLIRSYEELKNYVEGGQFEDSVDGISLIQEYVKPADGHIVRAEFIGGKYFYAVKVDSRDGFELCPADSCQIDDKFCPVGESSSKENKFKIIDRLPEEQILKYEQFLEEHNINVAAIEFIVNEDNEVYVYDINTNTNYNADAEKIAGKYAMLELAEYLKNELEKL